MPKKLQRRKRPEILNRNIEVPTFRVILRVGVDEPRDFEPEIEVKPWLELRGVLEEPVGPDSASLLSLYPDRRTKVGTARPPAVGAIIGTRPAIVAVVSLPYPDFDRLWSFVFSGHLKHV